MAGDNFVLTFVLLLILSLFLIPITFAEDDCGDNCLNNNSISTRQDFYKLFFDNSKINIYATRTDGVVEEYKLDIKDGIISDDLYSKPNAEIRLSEEILMDLLSSDDLLQDFFKSISSGETKYNLIESKGLFKTMGEFFKNLFGSTKDEKVISGKNDSEKLTCASDEYLECGICKILPIVHTVTGACSYLDEFGHTQCSNNVLGIDCGKLNPISWISDSQCVSECGSVNTFCIDGCKNLFTDTNNCGRCGTICQGTDDCISGVCGSCDDDNPCTINSGVPGNCVTRPSANNKVCGFEKLCQDGECV